MVINSKMVANKCFLDNRHMADNKDMVITNKMVANKCFLDNRDMADNKDMVISRKMVAKKAVWITGTLRTISAW